MGTVFPYKRRWRFKFKDADGEWRTVTSKALTKAEARSELHEKELEVERQNLGLAPRSVNPGRWTVADLMRWWLDTYRRHHAAHASNEGTVRRHILGAPIASKLLDHVQPGDVEQLLQSKEGQVAPGTVNHIRQFFVRAFNKARKAGKWHGANPAEDVDTRRVPEPIVNILAPEEVFPSFAALAPEQRPVFAAAIFTGFLKGELCGLRKDDADLVRRLVVARRSYERPFPKSKKQRVVAIPEEFVPFVECALRATEGPWLFPDEGGAMRNKTWQPDDVLRRALKRAGIVTGYTHVCRRSTCRFTEDRADDHISPCPRCGFKLWPKGNVRKIRFHDLRHTYASVLLMLGARLVSVQKLLGHSDPKITERRYGHLLPDFMKSEVDRLRFGIDALAPRPSTPAAFGGLRSGRTGEEGPHSQSATAALDGGISQRFAAPDSALGIPLVSGAKRTKREAGASSVSREVPASLVAGCTGLEPVASGVTVPPSPPANHRRRLQPSVISREAPSQCENDSQNLGPFRRRFGTPVVRNSRIEIGRVIPLTVREVASVLRVNRATIYSGVARGVIPHVRLGHALRIPVRPTA
ncbi:MAG TPA: tyrosine-type recombinase/integrase [Anaeromyxobacteraceae bacterium]|nr:tyrosine-type recombinase/integrase [Anaeromyxobacteraceae bacterium]